MRAKQYAGFSLVELLIVIALLGLIAAVATPNLFIDDEAALERAAARVASAFRYAHAEAVRTGQSHGVTASTFSQSVKVYRLDESVSPAAVVYDVRDPVTKQIYDLTFGEDDTPALSAVYFKFEGFFFPQAFVGFSGTTGVPKYNDSGTIRMLENAYIRVSHDGVTRTINLSPMTARVTVQ